MMMKIEYDPSLYKEIASYSINEIVQVENRKGRINTIHIKNIAKLSWHELQLLVADGSDRFSKMALLYRKYANSDTSEIVNLKGASLTFEEKAEINQYIEIFRDQEFSKHTQANNYISENGLWDEFKTIRSLNDHGKYTEVAGIQPKYFEIICGVLKIKGEGGIPLDSYISY